MKVIFVCLGNICRSPMTEAMFKKMVAEAGLADQITIDSAGTSNIAEGSPADSQTKAILDKYHIKDDGMIARQLQGRDYYDADYIVAMDQMNVRDAKDMAPAGLENKVHGIFEATPGKENCYIVDLWITHRFQDTYDSLSEALPNWLVKLKKEIK
ncbi:low molecular weight protein-tyrosine-phosphatase [Limosilactobacillus reuteri]|uniref:low molecular weight protein-tyrosine-phosphatase n=1 Tax=Limosilactobacillus reuteri TaxID=1598 RepID=UPI003D988455